MNGKVLNVLNLGSLVGIFSDYGCLKYSLLIDEMAEFVIQPQCKIPEFQRISMRVCGSIAQRLVFKQPCNHRLLTTEKVVYECKAIKLDYKFSRKNYLGLELFDCPRVCCVVLEL